MTGPGQPADPTAPTSTDSELAAAATADLLDLLPDLSAWRLDRDRWSRIERILDDLNAALAHADAGALYHAAAELERASPMLVHLIGATKVVPAPEPLRDQASRLIDSLRAVPGPVPAKSPVRWAVAGHPVVPARPTAAGGGEGAATRPR